MDNINVIQAIILGIVEGLTEFLPISSTGHLILANEFMNISGEKAKLFDVFIQLGAILAIVYNYREKILSIIQKLPSDKKTQNFALSIFIAFIPAAVVGLLTHKLIKEFLFGPVTVAIALIAGGLLILIIERQQHSNKISEMDNIALKVALFVGLAQVLSLFPGVSRSAATIMGGLLAGMTRKASTEFSFFLAIPTMFAATLFDLTKSISILEMSDFLILAIGLITAFISALWVIRWFIKFVSTNNFRPFAHYRIIFGLIFLVFFLMSK
ncbi:undecaprenyl-diphosphate phosphatase [Elusimicrobiota bacterium]